MDADPEIRRVTVVGTGLIGASWAACFLAHGLDVVATDPSRDAEAALRHRVEAVWPDLVSLERAAGFYTALGKRVLRVHKEVKGHVTTRLQAALYREVVHLIDQGVVSVADADAAVGAGLGLRWALMGPNLLFHLGGGPGGLAQ